MTWEGRRCGGFLTTQNQGQLGNLLKQTQKSNQPSQANHFSSKSKRNQGIVLHALGQNRTRTLKLLYLLHFSLKYCVL